MKPNLSDKKILVTGFTDGLGKLIAKHLAMQSAFVLLHGRSIKKGEIVLNEIYQLTQNEGLKPGSVIINMASVGQEPLDFSNLMLEKNYDGYFVLGPYTKCYCVTLI